VHAKSLANVFDFCDAGLDQLNDAKAAQRYVIQSVTIEGSLIDKHGAIAIEILKPNSMVNGHCALWQTQAACEIHFYL
jgi:hypothetical protein